MLAIFHSVNSPKVLFGELGSMKSFSCREVYYCKYEKEYKNVQKAEEKKLWEITKAVTSLGKRPADEPISSDTTEPIRVQPVTGGPHHFFQHETVSIPPSSVVPPASVPMSASGTPSTPDGTQPIYSRFTSAVPVDSVPV